MNYHVPQRAWLYRVALAALAVLAIYLWEYRAGTESLPVIYFGKPNDVLNYVGSSWRQLAEASLLCFLTAFASLVLAGFLAVLLLTMGLFSDGRLLIIERFAAFFQTLPILVIVTVCLLLERALFRALGIEPLPDLYCVIPVSLSLVFTPLASGVGAISRMPVPLKALLRLWDATPLWRIVKVYLPYAAAEMLTGLRASATWAVGAVLIAEALINGVPGSSNTLGSNLIRPFSSGPPGQATTAILVSTALGFLTFRLFVLLQVRVERLMFGKTSASQAFPLQSSAYASRVSIGETT